MRGSPTAFIKERNFIRKCGREFNKSQSYYSHRCKYAGMAELVYCGGLQNAELKSSAGSNPAACTNSPWTLRP